eukprot:1674738-Pyramimonas_sp.AAC.1
MAAARAMAHRIMTSACPQRYRPIFWPANNSFIGFPSLCFRYDIAPCRMVATCVRAQRACPPASANGVAPSDL